MMVRLLGFRAFVDMLNVAGCNILCGCGVEVSRSLSPLFRLLSVGWELARGCRSLKVLLWGRDSTPTVEVEGKGWCTSEGGTGAVCLQASLKKVSSFNAAVGALLINVFIFWMCMKGPEV